MFSVIGFSLSRSAVGCYLLSLPHWPSVLAQAQGLRFHTLGRHPICRALDVRWRFEATDLCVIFVSTGRDQEAALQLAALEARSAQAEGRKLKKCNGLWETKLRDFELSFRTFRRARRLT